MDRSSICLKCALCFSGTCHTKSKRGYENERCLAAADFGATDRRSYVVVTFVLYSQFLCFTALRGAGDRFRDACTRNGFLLSYCAFPSAGAAVKVRSPVTSRSHALAHKKAASSKKKFVSRPELSEDCLDPPDICGGGSNTRTKAPRRAHTHVKNRRLDHSHDFRFETYFTHHPQLKGDTIRENVERTGKHEPSRFRYREDGTPIGTSKTEAPSNNVILLQKHTEICAKRARCSSSLLLIFPLYSKYVFTGEPIHRRTLPSRSLSVSFLSFRSLFRTARPLLRD